MKNSKFLIFVSIFSLTVIVTGLFNNNKGLIKPSPNLTAYQVLNIQLQSLKNNKKLRNNLGIIQTYEFAHPENKKLTGPLFHDLCSEMIFSCCFSLKTKFAKFAICKNFASGLRY